MERILQPTDELDHDTEEELLVRAWRTEQLWRLGLPRVLAEMFADLVDWHALAELIERGCSPELALEIVR
jgi:class 3 adenylate cyclase